MTTTKTRAVRKRGTSINARLTWLVIGSVLVSTIPVTTLFVVRETARQAQARWSVMKTAADVLASSAEDAVRVGDRKAAYAAIRAVRHTPGIIYARVEDVHGGILAEMGGGARLQKDVVLDADSENPDIASLALTRTIRIAAPITYGTQRIGKVVVVHKSDDFAQTLLQSIAGVLGLAGLALGMALLIAQRIQRAMTQPLGQLTSSIEAITAKGDFSQRVTTKSVDEVGVLVVGFNTMLDAIAERDRKIEAHVETLEGEVADRTRDYLSARDAADSANAAKSDFLATMSHEIRTPMNGVMVTAELLAAETLPAKAQRFARTIAKSGRSLLAVINDILDFSKIEAGKLEVEICEIDILDVIDDACALFQDKAREKGLELVAFAAEGAPRIVPADPVRMGQVIANLISNALKFTESGHVLVQVLPDNRNGFWRLTVTDTGIGIAKDKLESIFEAFTQEDQTTTRRYGGTGLGLSISKKLVEAMGGAVAVTSKPGVGSTFYVRLPALSDAVSAAPPSLMDMLAPVVALQVGGPVEHEMIARRFEAAGAVLRQDGADLVIADKNGRQGLHAPADRLVLLADPQDVEADIWVREGRAACVLMRPLRHQDMDALMMALINGSGFRLKSLTPLHDGIDVQYPDARVLVVDDSEVNREVAIEALARFGIGCDIAKDGAQALQLMEVQRYDLVLMDGSMPIMDGFEASLRQRQAEQKTGEHVTIIALTAHVVGTAAMAWREAGMDDVLNKPFTLSDLGAVLGRWLPETLRQAVKPAAFPAAPEAGIPATGLNESDLFDIALIQPLKDGLARGRGDFVRRVIGLYRTHAPEALLQMAQARRIGDDEGLARAAHALKSMSLNLGAKMVAAVAGGIEKAVRLESRKVAADELVLAQSWLERTIVALSALIGEKADAFLFEAETDPEQVMLREIEAGLATGAFEMLYQPIYDRTGSYIISAEALVRWNRGDQTPIGPGVFVPLAERSGLITKIGAFVRRRVLEDTGDWAGLPVAVNVSPVELEQADFVGSVRRLLIETGFNPERLVLEVTETAFLGEPQRILQLFNELHDMGIKLALDDFGVGYSSLTSLHRFPFDKIKIDREFVVALDGEPRPALEALAIIQAVSGIGRAFGMQVVAEGIETLSQHTHLKAAGVHGMQGYLFGKPMPALAIAALLKPPAAKVG